MANVLRAPNLQADFWSPLRLLAQRKNGTWYALRPAASGAAQQLAVVTETKAQQEDWTNALATNAFNASVLTDGTTALTSGTPKQINVMSKCWLMQVSDVNNRFYLYKSVDEGASWGNNSPTYNNNAPVRKIGYYAGAHSPFVSLLGSRGIAERTAPGTGEMVQVEYNTNTTRNPTNATTAGNNQMVATISRDGGDTWSILFEQNTDLRTYAAGNNTTSWKHFHCVVYDWVRDLFWFGIGDRQADSAFWSWDPRYAWPANNCTLATLLATPGFNGIGGTNGIYNATDFIVLPNSDWIVHVTDGNDGGTSLTNGIYRFNAYNPATTFTRAYDMTQGGTDTTRLGAFGVRLNDGTLAVIEYPRGALLHRMWYIYTSNHPDGADWKRVGVVYPKDVAASDTPAPFDFLMDYSKSRIAWVHDTCAGKMPNYSGNVGFGTSLLKVRGIHDEYEPEPRILHPTYYVNSVTGAANTQKNAANYYSEGNYPDFPLASVNGVLGRTGACKGCTFILMKGHTETLAANATFDITDPSGLGSFTTPAAYVSTASYNVGDKVTGSNTLLYQCILAYTNPPGYDPTTDTTHWRQMTDTSPPVWIIGEGERTQQSINGGGASYIFYLGASNTVKGIRLSDFTMTLGATTNSPFQTDSGSAATLITGRRMLIQATTAYATTRLLGMYSCTFWDSDFIAPSVTGAGNVILASQAGRSIRAYNTRLSGGVETIYATNACTELTLSHCQLDTPFTRSLNLQSLPTTYSVKNTQFNKLTGAGTNGIFFAANFGTTLSTAMTGCSTIGFTTNTAGTAQTTGPTLGTTDPAADSTQRTFATLDANAPRDKAGRQRATTTTPGMFSFDGNQEVKGYTGTSTTSGSASTVVSGTVLPRNAFLKRGSVLIKT